MIRRSLFGPLVAFLVAPFAALASRSRARAASPGGDVIRVRSAWARGTTPGRFDLLHFSVVRGEVSGRVESFSLQADPFPAFGTEILDGRLRLMPQLPIQPDREAVLKGIPLWLRLSAEEMRKAEELWGRLSAAAA